MVAELDVVVEHLAPFLWRELRGVHDDLLFVLRRYASRPTIRLGSDTLRQLQERKTGRLRLARPAVGGARRDWPITYLVEAS